MNMLKPEIDESTPPRFLAGVDSALRKIDLGLNWQKYFIYRISLPLWAIATIEYAVLYSHQPGYDILVGFMGSFVWCFALSSWYFTRRLMAYWNVFFSFGVAYWSISLVTKIF